MAAVTHLALARRQNRRKRHFGYSKRESLVVQKIFTKDIVFTEDISEVQKNLMEQKRRAEIQKIKYKRY